MRPKIEASEIYTFVLKKKKKKKKKTLFIGQVSVMIIPIRSITLTVLGQPHSRKLVPLQDTNSVCHVVSDLLGNPDDRFSHAAAQMFPTILLFTMIKLMLYFLY